LLTALSVLLLYVKREQGWKKLCYFTFDACIGCKKRTALLVLSSLIWILLFWGFAHEFCQVVLIQIFSSFSFLKTLHILFFKENFHSDWLFWCFFIRIFGSLSLKLIFLCSDNFFHDLELNIWVQCCELKVFFRLRDTFFLTWQKSLKNFFTTFILNTSSL
jgi:hypothetical protein